MENIIKSQAEGEHSSVFDLAKILEISNFIDDWEQSVLFSPGGFYSLKGKSVLGKTKELLQVLKGDTEKILSETVFDSQFSLRKAEEIIKVKINTIQSKMLGFEESEKKSWELQTVESAIEHSKTKAKEYKNYPDMLETCYMNGLSALGVKSELTGLSKSGTNNLITQFNSDFFEEVVWSFVDDNSASALSFYEKNKKYILEEKRNQIEPVLSQLGNKLQAFETAKELLTDNDAESKLSKIKGEELKKYTKLYFEGFKNSKDNLLKEKRAELTRATWENIDKLLKENSDLALFEVDLNQDEKAINSQISYIKTMIKQGKTETDNKKFFELFKMLFEDFEKFEKENLYNFKNTLSSFDFDYFTGLKNNLTPEKYLDLKNEYDLIKQYFGKDDNFNVLLIKTLNREKSIWEKNNNKQISLIQAAQLIESVTAQIKKRNS
ncbi:hypothetical protein IKQ26_09730 [bacterium]|nr:hypothetical protein [bacterium]